MKKILYIFIIITALIIGIFVLSKSNKQPQKNASNKLKVSASFYPLFYFASQIGRDKADVKNITPAGVEPHDYEPTAQDIARIETSDLLILNGGVEPWAYKIKDNLKDKKVNILIAGNELFTKEIIEEGEKMPDPHIWLDPKLAQKETEKIAEGYIKVDSANSQYYIDNQKTLAEKLDQLDQKFKQGLKNCKSRDVVTSHEAFAYLAFAYNLNQVGISGISPDEEPSSKQLAEVAKFAKENNVQYIFFESLVSPKLAETIAQEVGAKTLVLDPLEGLSDDDIKQGKNYFIVMEGNLKNLRIALQCNN